jgi:hypothetical protein
LPVTTFRTIDLRRKKKSDPLFSGFWAATRDCFEENFAPECVHVKLAVGRCQER